MPSSSCPSRRTRSSRGRSSWGRGPARDDAGSARPAQPGAVHRSPREQVRAARHRLARPAESARGLTVFEEIRIRDLGVISSAELTLGAGLTVITGETGAGKTMVLSGLSLLLGGRADATRVRAGATQAEAEGRVKLPADSAAIARAIDAGAELDEDGSLVLLRTVAAEGRSRAYCGGRSLSLI